MTPQGRTYFQVILPLKLEWEPWYYTDQTSPQVGERVEVCFAGRLYTGVVSSVGGTPEVDTQKVQPMEDLHRALEPVTPQEIRYWRFLARYYMCTVGEVLKAAYPAGRDASEEKKSRKRLETAAKAVALAPLSEEAKSTLAQVRSAFEEKRPVLLEGIQDKFRLIETLASECIGSGRDVLVLEPSKPLVTKFFKQVSSQTGLPVVSLHTPDTYPQRREIARILRSTDADGARLIVGTRSALYLPFSKLGLVIVDREEDSAYKLETQAPRLSGRDAAIALAAQHKADCMLCSCSPSLEALYNCSTGKLRRICIGAAATQAPEFIDTLAEKRKNGMNGEYSRKLLAAAQKAGGKPMYICPWPLEGAVRPSEVSEAALRSSALVAILHAEALCMRQDFRADEKLLHLISDIRESFEGPLYIQTSSRTSLPSANMLLDERKAFGMPPFKRLVDIVIKDKSANRLNFIADKLQSRLRGLFELQGAIPSEECVTLRLVFSKDKNLDSLKASLYDMVLCFEKEFKYFSHIHFNVDP